jgi:predicted dehydrogenase
MCADIGIPFFIEKPLSNTTEGLDQLFNWVKQKSLVVEAGFMMRFHPNLIWVRDQIQSCMYGDVMYMRAMVGNCNGHFPDCTFHHFIN